MSLDYAQFKLTRYPDARANVPRFLLRGFHPRSGGGDPALKGFHGIVPQAFLDGTVSSKMYDYPRLMLRKLIDGDLRIEKIRTPFSPWAANLQTAAYFGSYHRRFEDYCLAVVDTRQVYPFVTAYHAPQLESIGLASGAYPHEYLLYGQIQGKGVTVMRWKYHWCTAFEPSLPRPNRNQILQYFVELMRKALAIEQPSGGRFVLPLATAPFTNWAAHGEYRLLWPNDISHTSSPRSSRQRLFRVDGDFVAIILHAPEGVDIPHEYSLDDTILRDIVYWCGYPQIRDWVHLLRAPADARWCRGRNWAGRGSHQRLRTSRSQHHRRHATGFGRYRQNARLLTRSAGSW